jgi:hypothetical protein
MKVWKREGRHLQLPVSLAGMLKLPHTGTCLATSNENREIRLGPLIGVLTSVSSSAASPFGTRTSFVKEILQAGKNKSFYFAFSPRGVNWQQETVAGYFLDVNGRWVRRTVPFPDVIYNRLPSRKAEKTLSMSDFKQRFVRRGVPLFNWSFFDKSDVYKLLQNDDAYKYVPESHLNPTPRQIRDMMEKHRFVYLKPTAGSLGIGIYRLTYNPNRGYFVRYRRGGKNVLIRYPKFEGLMNLLSRQNGGKMSHYIVQQGIRLIELDSCPIDFRFHMTKNGRDQWVVAAIGAKKAGRGSVTTHIRTGGQLMTPEQVLGSVFGSRAGQILQSAKETAIDLAEAIERNYPHRLGELGFDIGIDQSESIWMFEANARPGRSIFKHPSLKSQGHDSLVNLYEHCLYLSKFRQSK